MKHVYMPHSTDKDNCCSLVYGFLRDVSQKVEQGALPASTWPT